MHFCDSGSAISTFAYDGDNLKRVEIAKNGAKTTLVWDGTDYLEERT